MKPRRLFFSALPTTLITVVCSVLAANFASAASQTWKAVATDGNWTTATNWVNGAVPGGTRTGNSTNADTATFNAVSNFSTIAIDANRFVNSIAFTAGAGAYTFTGGLLYLSQAGSINMAAGVTNPQVFSNTWQPQRESSQNGLYSFINNATDPAATLTFNAAASTVTNGNGRPTTLTLDGTNTGENLISANLTDGGSTTVTVINKIGAGTWVLSGANTFTGGSATNAANGIQISGGTLVAANNAALGTNGTANTNQVSVNNGGTLQLRGGITLDNGIVMNLFNGGTITSNGSNATNGRINVGAFAAAGVTLSTVNASDVFTIGNGTNDFQGGLADTVTQIAGPGTVFISTASTAYLGSWSISSGALRAGSSTNGLGASAAVAFGAGSTGKLQLNATNLTLTGLNTNATPGTAVVENGTAGASTLTVNNGSPNTFAGSLQDGVAGTLGITKSGAGTLNLSGASTYTGATTISTGVLNLTGSLGTTAVSGGSGATFSGNGTMTGGATIGSNVHIAPGDGGDAAIGTMTVGTLALNTGSQLDFGITNTTTLDKIAVSTNDGLTVTGGQLNINGGLSAFTAIGTYPLISHTGTAIANINSLLTVNSLNKSVTRTYTFTDSGGFVNLVVADSGVVQTFWNVNADGNWSTNGNWTPATAPNAVQAFVGFGGGGTEITADRTITVNGSFTAGTLAFNGAAFGKSYTLADGGGSNITLDNGASNAGVTDTSGNHTINSPLTLTSSGVTFAVINGADTLTVGGAIGGSGTPLIKAGPGTLALNGSSTYTNGTTIDAGTLLINNAASMGDPASTTTINAATLRATADISGTRPFNISNPASTISVASGITYSINGVIADAPSTVGTLNKADSGTLGLTGTNTYTGGTVINAGTVQINNAGSLGNAAGAVTINNATLQATATIAGTRNFTLGNANSTILVDPTFTYTIGGVIGGSGALNKTGTGTLAVNGVNTYAGGTIVSAGTLAIGGSVTGGITMLNGTILQTPTGGLGNAITLSGASAVASIRSTSVANGTFGTITGSADQTFSLDGATQVSFSATTKQFQTLLGTFLIPAGTFARLSNTSLNNGGDNTTFEVNGFLTTRNNGAVALGALTGSGTVTTGGSGSNNTNVTYTIGAKGIDSTFSGSISDGDTANGKRAVIVKTGAGILTLSGINTYTGNTTVSAGALTLADNGGMKFQVFGNGVNNKVTGAGIATLDGDFTFDLAGANTANGNSWTIVDAATKSFGTTFSVVGFTETSDVWTMVDGGKTWTFTESTGVLGLVSTGYAGWAGTNAGGQTANLDFDNDGVSNGVEYFMNAAAGFTANPVLDGSNVISWTNGGNLSPSAYGTEFVVQTSNDLSVWTDVPVGSLTSNTAGLLSYTLTGTAPRFVRLKVTPN